jgi:hypothetical protein
MSAFELGYVAQKRGAPISANPYYRKQAKYLDWVEGWITAKDERS